MFEFDHFSNCVTSHCLQNLEFNACYGTFILEQKLKYLSIDVPLQRTFQKDSTRDSLSLRLLQTIRRFITLKCYLCGAVQFLSV